MEKSIRELMETTEKEAEATETAEAGEEKFKHKEVKKDFEDIVRMMSRELDTKYQFTPEQEEQIEAAELAATRICLAAHGDCVVECLPGLNEVTIEITGSLMDVALGRKLKDWKVLAESADRILICAIPSADKEAVISMQFIFEGTPVDWL